MGMCTSACEKVSSGQVFFSTALQLFFFFFLFFCFSILYFDRISH